MRRSLVRLTAVAAMSLGAAIAGAGTASAADPAGPPAFVEQDRSVFACGGIPDPDDLGTPGPSRNLGGRCLQDVDDRTPERRKLGA